MTTHTIASHSLSFKRIVVCNLVVALGCICNNIFLAFLIKLAKNSTNTKSTPVNV
jgi:hypothetical protein